MSNRREDTTPEKSAATKKTRDSNKPLLTGFDLQEHHRQMTRIRPAVEALEGIQSRNARRKSAKPGGRPRLVDDREMLRKMVAQKMPWKQIKEEMDRKTGKFRAVRAYQYLYRTDPAR